MFCGVILRYTGEDSLKVFGNFLRASAPSRGHPDHVGLFSSMLHLWVLRVIREGRPLLFPGRGKTGVRPKRIKNFHVRKAICTGYVIKLLYWFIIRFIAEQKTSQLTDNQHQSPPRRKKKRSMNWIPHFQVRSNCLILYDLPNYPPARAHKRIIPGQYSGNVTDGSRKRILKAVDIFLQRNPETYIWNPVSSSYHPFRLGFMTLTISDRKTRSHRETYPLLKELIRTGRRKYGLEDYIWKAEIQARGQIHYHLTISRFWHWQSIRDEWNKLQRRAGFLEDFGLRYGHYTANSTDVHSVKDVKNLGAYICKYIAKEVSKSGTQKIDGKVWDCSEKLKEDRFSDIRIGENEVKIREALRLGEAEAITLERCTIIKTPHPEELLTPTQLKKYQLYLQ